MNMTFRLFAVALFLGSFTVALAQDPQTIVHDHADALGGKKAIQAVQTIHRTAVVDLGNGQAVDITFMQKRPNLLRQEINFQGIQIIQAYDGLVAWAINPAAGSAEPAAIPKAQADILIRRSFMDDILWETQKKRQVELAYQGKETMDGHDYHHVLVTFKDGFTQDRFYDVKTKLLHQINQKAPDQTGAMIDTVTTFSDYRKVGSVKYPYLVSNSQGQSVTFKETKINTTLDDQLFSMPANAIAPQ